MTHFRATPTTLRVLLMTALGASLSACGGQADHCRSGDDRCGTDGSTGGVTSTGGGGSGGTGQSGGTGGLIATTGGAPSTGGSDAGCTGQTQLLEGVDTGIFSCSEGYLHRAEAIACPSVLPRGNDVSWPADNLGGAGSYTTSTDDCSTDADCGEHGYCTLVQTNTFNGGCMNVPPPTDLVPDYARLCTTGCTVDADCGLDQVCVCGDLVGSCWTINETAGCKTDADCGDGLLCLQNSDDGSYFSTGTFACELPGDQCDSAADCASPNEYCSLDTGATGRTCHQEPICGRPFLVEAEARIAPELATAAWLSGSDRLDVRGVSLPEDGALRQALAEHWTRVGLLEHASVAAFARFTLQLLSLGAPAELVEASNEAQRDETRHAKIAFELASHYKGHSVGPGPLALDGAFSGSSVEAILRTTIQEGCMGETRAALEASRAAELCEDAVVRNVLAGIAADESRHAELAWKVVHWIVQSRPELSHVMAEEFLLAERAERGREESAAVSASPSTAARHGLLEPAALAACHSQAQREVIGPCARTLLAMTASLA